MAIGEKGQISAGILLYKKSPLRVYLAHMGGPFFAAKDNGAWSIPKGLVESGENLLDAAKREFREETGYMPSGPFEDLGFIRMSSGKTVYIWACAVSEETTFTLRSNTFTMEWPKGSGKMQSFPEMDKGGWFDLDAANIKIVSSQKEFLNRLSNNMTSKPGLKEIVNEVIKESAEQSLVPFQQIAQSTNSVEDFMKKLVGKKLKNLLDATSFARLYVMNKYGVGSNFDDEDLQVLVSKLMESATAFINFRRLEPMGKQRDEHDKIVRSTPEYSEWNKKRSVAIKNYLNAQRSGDQSAIDKARKEKDDMMSADPTLADYRKLKDDMSKLVDEFHNSPLTLQDVLPGPDDSENDKKRWNAVVTNFNKLKDRISMNESQLKKLIKSLIKEVEDETGGNYPTATLQVFTDGGKRTQLLLYKGDARTSDKSSDVSFKTPTPFASIIRDLDRTTGTRDDEDVKSILRNLTPEELKELETEKIIVTTNIPNEILDLTGKHIPKDYSDLNEWLKMEIKNPEVRKALKEYAQHKDKSKVNKDLMEIYEKKDVMYEIDWSKFSDVKPSACLSPDAMKARLNDILKRSELPAAKRPKRDINFPIVHGKTITKDDGGDIDIKDFIKRLTTRPNKLFSINEKAEHTETEKNLTINIGIPAFKALLWDADSNEFKVITTCPGAGQCVVGCFAMLGNYIRLPDVVMGYARRLQFLMDDPTAFEQKAYAEALGYAAQAEGMGKKLHIRWNDSGDFFTQTYFEIAKRVTKKIEERGFSVKSFIYTKNADIVDLAKQAGFVSSFSTDARVAQRNKLNPEEVKLAVRVPDTLFKDLFIKNKGNFVKDSSGKPTFIDPVAGRAELKQRIYDYFKGKFEGAGLTVASLIFTDELPSSENPQNKFKYNLIVLPSGDGDWGAQRWDVKNSYLLEH